MTTGQAVVMKASHEPGSHFAVHYGGIELARYVYRSDAVQRESPRPYLHPMRTRGGAMVTLDRPLDHVWHRGLSWSLPNVGEDNFWGDATYVRGRGYIQLENNGSMEHVRVLELAGDEAWSRFGHELHWRSQRGEPVIRELRTLEFRLVSDVWILLFDTRMRNVRATPIRFGSPTTNGRENAGYGGLFWRGPDSFRNGWIRAERGGGETELRGTDHEWMGYTGRHSDSGASSTLVMVDDSENPRHPSPWFVRSEDFAGLCPAPFFREELELGTEEEFRFRYAVVVADGYEAGNGARVLADLGRTVLEMAPG